jgi:fructokinase
MENAHMHSRVRDALRGKLAGYDTSLRMLDMNDYLVGPSAGAPAGLAGALALAYRIVTRQWPVHWSFG